VRKGNDEFIDKPLAGLEQKLKDVMGAWQADQRRKEIAKAEKRAAKAPTEEQAADIVALAKRSKPAPEIPGLRATTRWDFDVVSDADVPAYFEGVEIRSIKKEPILKLIRATEGAVEIPGIRPVKRDSLAG